MPVDNVACDVSDENDGYDHDGLDFGEGDDESEISDDDDDDDDDNDNNNDDKKEEKIKRGVNEIISLHFSFI